MARFVLLFQKIKNGLLFGLKKNELSVKLPKFKIANIDDKFNYWITNEKYEFERKINQGKFIINYSIN